MNYSAPLYLASSSRSRKELLELAQIPFSLAVQSADESLYNWKQNPEDLVITLARAKMDAVVMPEISDCFILTADTICVDLKGTIHGKPENHDDAIRMLTLWKQGSWVLTGFCLERRHKKEMSWTTIAKTEGVVTTKIEFSVPDEFLEEYLRKTPSFECAGAMAIEGYGFQFVQSIQGSYSNIIGLPMYEVREALNTLGFFVP